MICIIRIEYLTLIILFSVKRATCSIEIGRLQEKCCVPKCTLTFQRQTGAADHRTPGCWRQTVASNPRAGSRGRTSEVVDASCDCCRPPCRNMRPGGAIILITLCS